MINETTQQLIVASGLGAYDRDQQTLIAVGWLLLAGTDKDLYARGATRLADVISHVAASGSAGLVGQAFEHAVLDLLGPAAWVMPDVKAHLGTAASLMTNRSVDWSDPRAIGVAKDRRVDGYFRTSLDDAYRLVSPSSVLATPGGGRPIKLTGHSRQDRLSELMTASHTGRVESLRGTTAADIAKADILMGSSDGSTWVGVDVKSGNARCKPGHAGVHIGVSEDAGRPIGATHALYDGQPVPPTSNRFSFLEVRLGTDGTPLGALRRAVDLLPRLAGVRPTSKLNLWDREVRMAAETVRNLAEQPLDEAIRHIFPREPSVRRETVVAKSGLILPPGVAIDLAA